MGKVLVGVLIAIIGGLIVGVVAGFLIGPIDLEQSAITDLLGIPFEETDADPDEIDEPENNRENDHDNTIETIEN